MPDDRAIGNTSDFRVYDDAHLEAPETSIGRYRLVQQIGQGGFGVVWHAEQTEPVRRAVALKIIKLGMDTKQVIARFEAERQALALLDHPNIAKVFDAGTTTTGRPYFVMELVRGVDLVGYCDSAKLTTDERLRLFIQVCQAIQHAHQKGIIHRDIKPSNVLVTLQDGKPVPKVIDFGIAKATAAEITGRTFFTERGQMIGTPAYMSPEQAEVTGLDIDTRSDIYSLGVVLYEILTGTTPFDPRDLHRRGLAEMVRVIREVEPERPSTRISTQGDAASTTAARRNVDVPRLRSLLRGDLDWIAMRCLEKDRTRRYESAGGLALDIERHLAGDPVAAAPPSATYRIRKFVVRNRSFVVAAGVVTMSLVAGLVGTLWQARTAEKERDRASAEADRANAAAAAERKRAEELDEVAAFQARMLSQVDPAAAGTRLIRDIEARFRSAVESSRSEDPEEATERFAADLARVNATDVATTAIDQTIITPAVKAIAALGAPPTVEATLSQTLASVYLSLGRPNEAEPLAASALASRRAHLGNEHPDTIKSILGLGNVVRQQGRFSVAEALYAEALAMSVKLNGPEAPLTLVCRSNVAGVLRSLARLDEAERMLREVMEIRRRTQGPDHPATLEAISSYGGIVAQRGRLIEAEPYYFEALDGRRRRLGAADPATISSLADVAALLLSLRRFDDAERYGHEAVGLSERAFGADHPSTVDAVVWMAALAEARGRLSDAERDYRAALDRVRRALGPMHPSALSITVSIANLLQQQNRFDEALPLHEAALAGYRVIHGDNHVRTIMQVSNMGVLMALMKRSKEAEEHTRECLERSTRVLGADHFTTVTAKHNLSALMVARGDHAAAEPLGREAVDAMARLRGAAHDRTAHFRINLGLALTGLSRFEEAERELLMAERDLGRGPVAAQQSKAKCAAALTSLYDAWERAAPGSGHAERAASRRR